MSTNYYWHGPACPNPCDHCSGPVELHIGQHAGGWSFEGHFLEGDPWLVSAVGWRKFLRDSRDGVIKDEYGRVHEVEEFIAFVDAVPALGRRRQYDWLNARRAEYGHRMDAVQPYWDWLDGEGYSFHGGDFS